MKQKLRKRLKAQQIASRCYSVGFLPPRWVQHQLTIREELFSGPK